MDDLSRVAQVVLRERQGRDRGWWDQMLGCYWPDSQVTLSWFSGAGPEFVRRSQEMAGRGDLSRHRNTPPTVHVQGNRALAELPTAVEVQVNWQGTPADLISYTRVNERLERRGGEWRILTLDCIYERDSLTSAIPGQTLRVNPERLAHKRRSYALLAVYLDQRGYPVSDTMLGDDQPGRVEAFYAEALRWLREG